MARVLIQGLPFGAGAALRRYAGPHEVRWMCGLPESADHGYWLRYDINRDDIDAILAAAGEWRPDLLLFFSPEDQPPPLGIERCPLKTAAVPADWSHTFPRLYATLGKFDVTATDYPGATRAQWGNDCRPHYFGPVFTYIPELHRDHQLVRDIDVLYAGSMNHALRPERGLLLPRLQAMSDRRRIVITSDVYGEDYARLMSRARLVFNYSARGELNLRFFETLACGAVPMIERVNPEAHQEFRGGEDVLLFGLDDFEQRIDDALAQPAEIDALRMRAAARAPAFAPEILINRFIDGALAAPSNGRPMALLPQQEQRFRDCMAHSGSSYPSVRVASIQRLRSYANDFPSDPRAWTLMAMHLLTPLLHLFMACDNEEALKPPVRQALEKAAALAPDDALHLANAAWACHWCGDAPAARAWAARALGTSAFSFPELLIGSVQDPAWARYMLATGEGAQGERLRALLGNCLAPMQ